MLRGEAAAAKQISLMTGEADATVRFRLIQQDRTLRQPAIEFCDTLHGCLGLLTDKAEKGWNVYVFAQHMGPCLTLRGDGERYARDSDVERFRVCFVDGDDVGMPSVWHIPPTFTLTHSGTSRWWAFWRVISTDPETFTERQKKLALHYKTDQKVCNPSRIVRLAGFARWKAGENFSPYDLVVND